MNLYSACCAGDVAAVQRIQQVSPGALAGVLNVCGDTVLNIAIRFNHEHLTEHLLNHLPPDHASPDGRPPLVEASAAGHRRIIEMLLDRGADIDLGVEEPPLTAASRAGKADAVALLLRRGARRNAADSQGNTAMMEAARRGHDKVVRMLRDNGASVDMVNSHGWTALMYACAYGYSESAMLLISFRADAALAENTSDGRRTALMLAAREGMNAVVQCLVNQNAVYIDAQSSLGKTALMYACENGHTQVAKTLIRAGCSVDIIDHENTPALIHAIRAGYPGVAESLIRDGGAAVNPVFRCSTTALIEACMRGMHGLTECILIRGGRPNLPDAYGSTALMWAANHRYARIVRLLLDAGACPNRVNALGWTPLMYAISYNCDEVCHMLMDHGADVDLCGCEDTPLILACCARGGGGGGGGGGEDAGGGGTRKSVVERMIEMGADVDATKADGTTPLHAAICNNNRRAMVALLNRGAAVAKDDCVSMIVKYINELRRDRESLIRAIPHVLAAHDRGPASRAAAEGVPKPADADPVRPPDDKDAAA